MNLAAAQEVSKRSLLPNKWPLDPSSQRGHEPPPVCLGSMSAVGWPGCRLACSKVRELAKHARGAAFVPEEHPSLEKLLTIAEKSRGNKTKHPEAMYRGCT